MKKFDKKSDGNGTKDIEGGWKREPGDEEEKERGSTGRWCGSKMLTRLL